MYSLLFLFSHYLKVVPRGYRLFYRLERDGVARYPRQPIRSVSFPKVPRRRPLEAALDPTSLCGTLVLLDSLIDVFVL